MPPSIHTFLFSPPEDLLPLTARRVHLRRLCDVLHLSIQRGDLHRARRAWAILARCKEFDWRASWNLALGLLDRSAHRTECNPTKINHLRAMMLYSPEDREPILCELVHLYVVAGRHGEALEELEFSLPSFPYHDNALLHIYAGICSVIASQDGSASEAIDTEMLDRAQIFFERAKSLDPGNIVVDPLLAITQNLTQNAVEPPHVEASDDEADSAIESVQTKKLRT